MDEYQRGRRDGMIEAMGIWCVYCENLEKYPIEYVGQLGEWFHRLRDGSSSKCNADALRKLVEREFKTEDEGLEIVRPKGPF